MPSSIQRTGIVSCVCWLGGEALICAYFVALIRRLSALDTLYNHAQLEAANYASISAPPV